MSEKPLFVTVKEPITFQAIPYEDDWLIIISGIDASEWAGLQYHNPDIEEAIRNAAIAQAHRNGLFSLKEQGESLGARDDKSS